MSIKPISLTALRRAESYDGSDFKKLYEKILTDSQQENFSDEDKLFLLRWSVLLLNRGNHDAKKLGYRIALRYANVFKDYIPLYDISLNLGFIPVAKVIEEHHLDRDLISGSFFKTLQSSYKDLFKDEKRYLSGGQKALVNFSKKTLSDSLIVAPTSYGKSEIMISKVLENIDHATCIIVPSKALLAQTKKRLFLNQEFATNVQRVITHPEMYRKGEKSFVAVLTQERLLRMLQIDPDLLIDHLLIDEAHNLLVRDSRAELLIQVLLILKKRNDNIKLSFFTPFIAQANSLESRHATYALAFKDTKEFIKVERYFIYDFKNGKKLYTYDQFVNRHIKMDEVNVSEMDFIHKFKAKKNILYSNKPRQVEEIALKIANTRKEVDLATGASGEFAEAYKSISDFLHPDYNLLKCIKKGVVYHHGKVPEIVRLYIESIFSNHDSFEFIATTSTLLEGVNIPAEKIFLLSVKRGLGHLSKPEFRNLAGRVCRFSETFTQPNGDLRMLEPEIYIINGSYSDADFNPYTFLEKNAFISTSEKDDVENILLKKDIEGDDIEKERAALEYIENLEPGTIDTEGRDIRIVSSEIAKSCFKNNVHEFDIHKFEHKLVENLKLFPKQKISEYSNLLDAINGIFVSVIASEENERHKDFYDLARLSREKARNFYAYFLKWKATGSSYKKMITEVLWYWQERQENARLDDDTKIYVGTTWGDVTRTPDDKKKLYIDLREKSREEKINLAIVKIKDELDFVEYKLIKFIDVLNEIGLIEESFYTRIKYGTSNPETICLLKNGISMELARALIESYAKFMEFDIVNDTVRISPLAIEEMKKNKENSILIFELNFHVYRG